MSTSNSDPLLTGIGVSCILGALGGIILTRMTLGSLDEAVLYWLIYVVSTSVMIVPQTAVPIKNRLFASVISPVAVLLVLLYKVTALGKAWFSALPISATDWRHVAPVLVFFYVASVTAIFICSFSRQVVVQTVEGIVSVSPSKAKRIEQTLNYAVKIGGTIALIVKAASR